MSARIAGIFVGGASLRMGGAPKGLLAAPGGAESLVARLIRICGEAGLSPVLVGRHAAIEAAFPAIEALDDHPPGIGPLGGITALLHRAGNAEAVALACDLPAIDSRLLRLLCAAAPGAAIVAPCDDAGRWQTFFSRWMPAVALPLLDEARAAGQRSLQPLLARYATPVQLDAADWRVLRDWDTPADVAAG